MYSQSDRGRLDGVDTIRGSSDWVFMVSLGGNCVDDSASNLCGLSVDLTRDQSHGYMTSRHVRVTLHMDSDIALAHAAALQGV